jgi:hypothetical protein
MTTKQKRQRYFNTYCDKQKRLGYRQHSIWANAELWQQILDVKSNYQLKQAIENLKQSTDEGEKD